MVSSKQRIRWRRMQLKHKDHYNDQYILELSEKLSNVQPDFNSENFSTELIGNLEEKELFARFDFIVDALEKI